MHSSSKEDGQEVPRIFIDFLTRTVIPIEPIERLPDVSLANNAIVPYRLRSESAYRQLNISPWLTDQITYDTIVNSKYSEELFARRKDVPPSTWQPWSPTLSTLRNVHDVEELLTDTVIRPMNIVLSSTTENKINLRLNRHAPRTPDDYMDADLSSAVLTDPEWDSVRRQTRMVGIIECSWNWQSSERLEDRSNSPASPEYRKACERINVHMVQANTRYGFIITDVEIVPVRRKEGRPSDLEVPPKGIKWHTGDAAPPAKGELTGFLLLWYLNKLAADEDERVWKAVTGSGDKTGGGSK
ncbi:hypothetical protein BU17DRAFT_93180 [Hysterangium stoloniferum]|nr:hypothetical protein BU17DRAFT_93180 [Hysterangium stoloniferum]